jgi:hypothetical protein
VRRDEMQIWEMSFEEYRQSVKGHRIQRFGGFNRHGVLLWKYEAALCSAIQARKPVPETLIRFAINFGVMGQMRKIMAI